jgi:outer membrane protein TolC
LIDAVRQGDYEHMSRTALGCLLIVLSPVLATGGPASGDGTFPVELLWRHDLTTLPAELQPEASDEIREVVTREEAVDLALQANRLAKNPERLKFITETVKKAYAGVLDSHGVLAMREEHLNACREVKRIVLERAAQAKASPSEVLAAQVALAKATEDVLSARHAAMAQTAQLNHLMGRDPQARLRVRTEPDLVPATALRAGTVTVSGQ